MKSFNLITGILRSTLLATTFLALLGCEGDGEGLVGSITINPTEFTWTTVSNQPDTCLDTYNDVVFKIDVQRADGDVTGETDLTAIVTHGGNTTNNLQRAFMYADTNNNFVIDANEPIVNEPGDPAFTFTTDNLGQAHVNVRFLTHCLSYDGSLGVYGNGSSEIADFSVEVTAAAAP